MLLDGSVVNPIVAFIAGFVSFLAPCFLAIVPVQALILADRRKKAIILALAFILGFTLVFMLLGASANTLGRTLAPYRDLVQKVGGAFLIFLGLTVLGIWRLPIFYRELRVRIEERIKGAGYVSAFLVGITFGFAWSPCIGPVLAVILFWASQVDTLGQGLILMFFYSLGLAVPFLVLSLFMDRLKGYLVASAHLGHFLELVFGFIIVLVGVLLISGQIGVLISYTLRFQ